MNVLEALPACLEGVLVAQLAQHRGLGAEEVFANDRQIIKQLRQELDALGINCKALSDAHVDALVGIFSTDRAIDDLGAAFAELLWHLLGDPETGGKKPPQRYVEATQTLWVSFLGAINPRFLAAVQELRKSHE